MNSSTTFASRAVPNMPRAAFAGAVVVFLLLPGCMQAPSEPDAADDGPTEPEILAERPVWEPGYTWHWVGADVERNSRMIPNHVNLTVLRPFEIEGRSGWLAAKGRSVSGGMSGGAAMEHRDPDFVHGEHLGIQLLAINLTPREPGECLEYGVSGFWSPPFLVFPLVAGKRWNGTERLTQFFDGRTGMFHQEAVVIGRDPITVQGVRYEDAVRIEQRYWISAEERGDEASPANHSLYTQPTVIHYSATARHIVRVVYGLETWAPWPPGRRVPAGYFWSAEQGFGAYFELRAADLTPKPPSTPEEETYWWTHDPYVMERGCAS
jgi:hypothetical protein